jgi:hypothetical protein
MFDTACVSNMLIWAEGNYGDVNDDDENKNNKSNNCIYEEDPLYEMCPKMPVM